MHTVEQDGFAIVPGVFGESEVNRLIGEVSRVAGEGVRSRGGVYAIRNLLRLSPAIRELAWSEGTRSLAGEFAFPVRATLFDKAVDANWLVPWHQDLTICVGDRLEVPGYGPWTKKAGVWNVQPPVAVLERMVSVRIHLDDCNERNGALRVIPSTHRLGRLTAPEIGDWHRGVECVTCVVGRGGVVLMRPLLLHASSAGCEVGHRRVIHIDYAFGPLEGGLQWAE